MKTYRLTYSTSVTVAVEVDARDENAAISRADELVHLRLCQACSQTMDPSKTYTLETVEVARQAPRKLSALS